MQPDTSSAGPHGPAIAFDNLSVRYGGLTALEQVSGTIARGEALAVVGPNGGGKSTLLKSIAGILRPAAGTVHRDRSLRFAYLPQQSAIDCSVPMTVAELVSLGLWREAGWFGRIDAAARQRVAGALAACGLTQVAGRTLDALSAGQLQRALFARLLLEDADLVLLDEPFTAMDQATVTQLIRIIDGWRSAGRTVIAALHDLDEVRAMFPRVLVVAGKPLAWGATEQMLTSDLVARAFAFATADHAHHHGEAGSSAHAHAGHGHGHERGHGHE